MQSDYVTKSGKHIKAHQIRGHCVRNPSGRDQIYRDEMNEIAERYFPKLKSDLPSAPVKFKNDPDQYDAIIIGWCKYWNKIFPSSDPLDPLLVKALIESESSYKPETVIPIKPRSSIKVRGLMQLTDETIKALGDEDGEIRDHYVNITREDALDPNLNICAGIRWLFHKRKLASSKLRRNATWFETVATYKSCLPGYRAGEETDMDPFLKIFERFKGKI